eukprot:Nk52_evm9s2473 gene=Nk52_evmTU9s2473
MSVFDNKLVRIAIVGGVFTSASCTWFYYKARENFSRQYYYEKPIDIVRKDERAMSFLGGELNSQNINLGDGENVITQREAKVNIPVTGKKPRQGHIRAESIVEDGKWNVQKVILHLDTLSSPYHLPVNSESVQNDQEQQLK